MFWNGLSKGKMKDVYIVFPLLKQKIFFFTWSKYFKLTSCARSCIKSKRWEKPCKEVVPALDYDTM